MREVTLSKRGVMVSLAMAVGVVGGCSAGSSSPTSTAPPTTVASTTTTPVAATPTSTLPDTVVPDTATPTTDDGSGSTTTAAPDSSAPPPSSIETDALARAVDPAHSAAFAFVTQPGLADLVDQAHAREALGANIDGDLLELLDAVYGLAPGVDELLAGHDAATASALVEQLAALDQSAWTRSRSARVEEVRSDPELLLTQLAAGIDAPVDPVVVPVVDDPAWAAIWSLAASGTSQAAHDAAAAALDDLRAAGAAAVVAALSDTQIALLLEPGATGSAGTGGFRRDVALQSCAELQGARFLQGILFGAKVIVFAGGLATLEFNPVGAAGLVTGVHELYEAGTAFGAANRAYNATVCADIEPLALGEGEPHLRTLDGVAYDAQVVGEFDFLVSGDSGFRVQVRQEPYADSTQVAMITAVAAEVGDDVVEAALAEDGSVQWSLDGAALDVDDRVELPGGGRVWTVGPYSHVVVWPDGSTMRVTVGPPMINLRIVPSPAASDGIGGLVGSFDGDPRNDFETRDSSTSWPGVPPAGDLHDVFLDSWRLSPEDSLFTYAPGESTDTFTDRSFPSEGLSLDDLPPEQRAAGEAACPPELENRDGCIFDVGVTGDKVFARALQPPAVQGPVPSGTIEIARPRVLTVGGAVPQRSYSFTTDAPRSVYLRSLSPCTSDVFWTVTNDAGQVLVSSAFPACADIGRVDLPAAGTYHVVLSSRQQAADSLAFRLDETRTTTRAVELGSDVAGELTTPGEVASYEFSVDGPTAVTLTADPDVPCNDRMTWNVVAPSGLRMSPFVLFNCNDIGRLELPEAGTYAVQVTAAREPGPFGFTLVPG